MSVFAPRITSDTAIVYRVTATFDSGIQSIDVRVKILEAIPDPEFSLPSKVTWNGRDRLVLKPILKNAAALLAAPIKPSIHYTWRLSDSLAAASPGGDSLVVSKPIGNGVMKVQLCMSNGGRDSCRTTQVQIELMAAELKSGAGNLRDGVAINGGRILWRLPREVRILNGQGQVLWKRRGWRSSVAELPTVCRSALAEHQAFIMISP